jgi:prevent-host-death family protein
MIAIRPVSDLRNKFTDIESTVNTGQPVFLTKNGYGSMVVMSIDAYSRMNRNVEQALDEADAYAEETTERMSHEEVFGKLRNRING